MIGAGVPRDGILPAARNCDFQEDEAHNSAACSMLSRCSGPRPPRRFWSFEDDTWRPGPLSYSVRRHEQDRCPATDHEHTPGTMKAQERDELLQALKARFEKNMHRHEGMAWDEAQARLQSNPDAVRSLRAMEETGGEPDVIGQDKETGQFTFCDCSTESPTGRRSVCYDREALDSRKEHKPQSSAVEMAAAMGVDLLTEDQYRELQELGEFDAKTSSWIETPPEVRSLGGALFCDRRYGKVFVYHNGAQSYYAARGFRGSLRV